MSKSVTITLTKGNYYSQINTMGIKQGDFIRLGGYKRSGFEVKDTKPGQMECTLTVIKGYKPAPRSRLKHRTVFSKIKGRIF